MAHIVQALHSLRPNAQWTLRDSELEWNDKIQTQPTDAEIQAEITKLQAEWDSKDYARKRKAEYDQLNQYEMMFDDQRDGTTRDFGYIHSGSSRFCAKIIWQ